MNLPTTEFHSLPRTEQIAPIFIEYAHRHLARYACEVTRDRRYVCGGCGRPFKDLDLIRELLAERQSTIVCQKCRTEIELIDFIEQRLKSGNSYLRTRKSDGREVFDVKNERHLEYWISQQVDVYLVIRQQDEMSGDGTIRWMNVTRHLKNRKDKQSRQIIFEGHKLDMNAVWKVRDEYFPAATTRK